MSPFDSKATTMKRRHQRNVQLPVLKLINQYMKYESVKDVNSITWLLSRECG